MQGQKDGERQADNCTRAGVAHLQQCLEKLLRVVQRPRRLLEQQPDVDATNA